MDTAVDLATEIYSNTTQELVENVTTTTQDLYCKTANWDALQSSYRSIHGCSSLVVCIFGSIANIINMIVLTRKSMLSSTNIILTALALTDLLVMAEYIPFALHQYILTGRDTASRYSWGWALFVLFHAQFGQVFHTISISLTVTLAVWRYIAIACIQNNAVWCSIEKAKVAILTCFTFSLLFNIPNYINLEIRQTAVNNITVFVVDFVEMETRTLHNVNFIVYSVVLKLLPCVALSGLSFAIIKELLVAASRRAALTNRCTNGKKADAERQADRVTKMLLAILILFLISEVPQGILGLLYILPNEWFKDCYRKLAEIMDMLVLFNSAVNFILYCLMSKQFRDTFRQLFTPCAHSVTHGFSTQLWKRVPQTDDHEHYTCVTNV